MYRSTTATLKFARKGKRRQISEFLGEYAKLTQFYVDLIWDHYKIEENVPNYIPKDLTSQADTWLSARIRQCASKQASGIVKGTRDKQRRRAYVVNELKKKGQHGKARKLQKIINKTIVSPPDLNGKVNPQLDSRFIKIDLYSGTSFDGWVTLGSIGGKIKLSIPFKRHKHFNKLFEQGALKNSITLSKDQITFAFEIEDPKEKTEGDILGVDIGQTSVVSTSSGHQSQSDKHGHTLKSICNKLARKKKSSKAFRCTQKHRKNHINEACNKIDLSNVKQINLEKIKHLRYKKKATTRALGHWTYTEVFDKLCDLANRSGVLIKRVDPTYTSQRCSECGWVRKSNRKGESFSCGHCGCCYNADLNAARNIALELPGISWKQRLRRENAWGFFYERLAKEPVVPLAQKLKR